MSQRIVVTGTDTGDRQNCFSAGLAHLLGANYWKPIQAGVEGEIDSQQVARLSGLPADRIVPEHYRLKRPASPHHAAEIDGIRIDPDSLVLPHTGERPLVIEGAGGLMVPLNSSALYILYLRAVATSRRALRGHATRDHQSFPALDRGLAKAPDRHSWDRIHRGKKF